VFSLNIGFIFRLFRRENKIALYEGLFYKKNEIGNLQIIALYQNRVNRLSRCKEVILTKNKKEKIRAFQNLTLYQKSRYIESRYTEV